MKIKSKLALLALSSAFVLGSASAGGAVNDAFSGAFFGIGAGMSQFSSSINFSDSNTGVMDGKLGNYTGAADFELGYGTTTGSHYYFGGVAFYQYNFDNGADANITGTFVMSDYAPQYDIGLLARFGYVFTNSFLVYAEVGGQMSSINYKLNDIGGGTMNIARSPFGFVLGLGADVAYNECLHFGIEYRVSPLPNYYEADAFDSGVFTDVNQISAREIASVALFKLTYSFGS